MFGLFWFPCILCMISVHLNILKLSYVLTYGLSWKIFHMQSRWMCILFLGGLFCTSIVIITFTDTLYVFIYIWITVWWPFILMWKTSFSVLCRVSNAFSFSLCESFLTSLSFLKDVLSEYRILGWILFFSTVIMSLPLPSVHEGTWWEELTVYADVNDHSQW